MPFATGAPARKIKFGLAQKLNLPLNQKDDSPVFAPINVERRLIVPLPPPATAQYKAQPGITNESYELILNAIRSQGRTFERAPRTFGKFDEEELRDVILANLNTHFVDRATGETFCRKGKTDIHITEENRAVFIGECKVWSGEKELQRGLEQLLGYLTWRHCKAALIVFNKDRAKFIELLGKAPAALRNTGGLYLQDILNDPDGGNGECYFAPPPMMGMRSPFIYLSSTYMSDRQGKISYDEHEGCPRSPSMSPEKLKHPSSSHPAH